MIKKNENSEVYNFEKLSLYLLQVSKEMSIASMTESVIKNETSNVYSMKVDDFLCELISKCALMNSRMIIYPQELTFSFLLFLISFSVTLSKL